MATAYVLGTFDDPLEALHDFEGHAILVLLTGAEQDPDAVLDRDTDCGINDETVFLAPPPLKATAWAEAEATALLHVHCANPLDCPELDRVPIRSHGCAPPPNCIAEPEARIAAVARPVCSVPTFLPPRGVFVPPDPFTPEFPDGESLCNVNVTHTTYTGSGEWCGYFGNILNEHGYNNRYLNLTLSGLVTGLNNMNFIWYLYGDEPDPSTQVGEWTLEFSGSAAVDPSDNCSQADNLLAELHSNGAPIPMAAWGWDWSKVGIDLVSQTFPDPVILNRTTKYGHPVSGNFPEDGINIPLGTGRMAPGNVAIVNDTEKRFTATYGWFLGQFAGVWNSFGTAFVILSNENRLYDQLVLDGASVTPTQGSRIVSLDNETGTYEASISAVTFTIVDSLNEDGEEYAVRFRVIRTPDGGGDPEELEIWEYYTGDGTSGRELTFEIPGAVDSITEFEGECVNLIPVALLGSFDNFERLDASSESDQNNPASWIYGEVGAWKGWQAPMRILCGGTISYDSFNLLTAVLDEETILPNDVDSGYCWGGNWRFLAKNDLTWDDMEGKTDGETIGLWSGGIAWQAHGKFYEIKDERSFDTFEDYDTGTLTEWGDGLNWSSVGEFLSDSQPLAEDDFDAYADGAITVLDNGDGWDADGYFIT